MQVITCRNQIFAKTKFLQWRFKIASGFRVYLTEKHNSISQVPLLTDMGIN